MNKKGLYLTLAVAVVVAGAAYFAGLIRSNKDEAGAESTNTPATFITHTIEDPSLTLQTPQGFVVCEQQENFSEGIAAYIWSDGTCDHGGDGIDIQLFIFEDTGKDVEDFLREQGHVFFDSSAGNEEVVSATVDDRIIYSVTFGSDYLVAQKLGEKLVYIQSAINSFGREKNKDATDVIAKTVAFTQEDIRDAMQTYANESAGYALAYPADWTYDAGSSGNPAMFYDSIAASQTTETELIQGSKIEVYYEPTAGKTLDELAEQKDADFSTLTKIETKIDGVDAIRKTGTSVTNTYTNVAYFVHDTNFIAMYQYIPVASEIEKYSLVFDDVLATFRLD